MTTEESQSRNPHLSQLPFELWDVMVVEWQQRTTFGKLLYPIWIFESAMMWIAVLSFIAFMHVAAPLLRGFQSGPELKTPDIYKGGRNE